METIRSAAPHCSHDSAAMTPPPMIPEIKRRTPTSDASLPSCCLPNCQLSLVVGKLRRALSKELRRQKDN
ncbi:hypothetical protein I7I48_00787 [Histoplasma ohiense]|nr:hypothetical protein I7I48_00787 [Histoplasma ohiense (nom. inval.)]